MKRSVDELEYRIQTITTQIECLDKASELDLLTDEDEIKLNKLIIQRAHLRKELEQQFSKSKLNSILDKLNSYAAPIQKNPKRICDYFTS